MKTDQKLIEFALYVLGVLERDSEWSADTTDQIAFKALALDLADTDDDGMFRVNETA